MHALVLPRFRSSPGTESLEQASVYRVMDARGTEVWRAREKRKRCSRRSRKQL